MYNSHLRHCCDTCCWLQQFVQAFPFLSSIVVDDYLISQIVCNPSCVQTIVPLPPLPPEASRLMPDMTRAQVDSERRTLAQAAVAAIFAAQGFLVALALKLRITVASAPLGSASGPGGARAQGGALGRGSGAVRRVRAGTAAYASGAGAEGRLGGGAGGAALLSSFVDQRLLDAGGKMMRLDAAGNAAQARLAAAGLSWMPPFANVIVLITFGLAVMLNFTVAGTLLSPFCLLCCNVCTNLLVLLSRVSVCY